MAMDKLYMKALRAVTREARRSSGGKRISSPEERRLLMYRAREAAKSPVYGALESGRKLPMPSMEEQRRASKRMHLKEMARSYHKGWGRKKVAPEHRASMLEHAASLAGSKRPSVPWNMHEKIAAATRQRKNQGVARVGNEWFEVNHVKGGPSDGSPFFIGVGIGYDIARFVVFARGADDAAEIAEETWPKMFFEELKSAKKIDPDDEEWVITASGKAGKRTQDIRIFEKAREFHRTAKSLGGGRDYRLTDGRIIEVR